MELYKPQIHEYVNFMKSFKRLYPELYEKYFMVIEKSSGQYGSISISDAYEIKTSTREILAYIINEYYLPLNN